MAAPSVFLSGTLPPCPVRFNAAAWCLGADVPGDREAFVAVDPTKGPVLNLSFDALRDRVARAAGALIAAGVSPGDRVALLLGDVPEFPIAYFGAIAAGAVATPLSSQLTTVERRTILDAVTPKVVLGGREATMDATALAAGYPMPFAATRRDDPALLVFTSGSSGKPKGVLHAHRAFWARQSMRAGWHGIGAGDRVLHAGAFNWTFTLGVGLADTWSVGATAVLNAGTRAPEVWPGLVDAYDATVFAAAPAVYRRVLKYGQDLRQGFGSLRHGITAGEALSPAIADAWASATGKPLLEALGMSEVSTFVSTPPGRVAEAGIAGWPQPGRHVAVLGDEGQPVGHGEDGVLAVHRCDPGLMLGYWRDPVATKVAFAGDWFLTGDLVRMGKDGAITYLGRRDDRMNAQGYRVDPAEVEAAFNACDGVAECGAAEISIKDGLSVIALWIVAEDGVRIDRSVLLAAAETRLAAYKMPRELFQIDALPRTANGKLMRRALRDARAVPL